MWVLFNPARNEYRRGKFGGTPDLQKARTFSRKCDASNAWMGKSLNWEAIEVVIAKVDTANSAPPLDAVPVELEDVLEASGLVFRMPEKGSK